MRKNRHAAAADPARSSRSPFARACRALRRRIAAVVDRHAEAVESEPLRCAVEPLERRALFSAGTVDPVATVDPIATVDPAATAEPPPAVPVDVTPTPPPVIEPPPVVEPPPAVEQPSVRSVTPGTGATGVLRDAFVSTEVILPNGGIDPATLRSSSVYLYRRSDGKRMPATLNTSGAGDVIILRPLALLEPGVKYGFAVNSGLHDVAGVPFKPFVTTFTAGPGTSSTDPNVHFEKIELPNTAGFQYLGVTMGPDGRLYAGTTTGQIVRFAINTDGTLGAPDIINSLVAHAGGTFVTGLAFDPASTAERPVLWVSHTAAVWVDAPDWTGTISRLSGAGMETVEDKVIHLPRSARDHLTNQLAFGPDGALYFCQAADTAMGAPDVAWSDRPEHLLTAAILRLDTDRLGNGALDALTPDGGGAYNPFAAGAPLTIYASGVRNAYDLVWHSNGGLYAPANGSAAGGSTPGTPSPFAGPLSPRIDEARNGPYAGPEVPALASLTEPETDYLFRIEPGAYYGHPNPQRNEYTLNGGNPTDGVDPYEVPEYPVGTQPDRNWRPAVFDFGVHQSPNGAIEYHGKAFNGALDHKLLVVRYSGGDDIVALGLGDDGKVTGVLTGMTGMTGFNNPLDLVEHVPTGNIYVAEFGGQCITLLRPAGTSSGIDPSTGSGNGGNPGTGEDPDPPTPTPRPKRERQMVRKIERFAQSHDLTVPDLATVTGATELKNVYAGLKDEARRNVVIEKIATLAARKNYTLPNLTTFSLNDLLDLRKAIRKSKRAA